jgi:hypothetical protein
VSTDYAILTVAVPTGVILGALGFWGAQKYRLRKRNSGRSKP